MMAKPKLDPKRVEAKESVEHRRHRDEKRR